MRGLIDFVKTMVMGGVVVILPIVVVLFLLAQAVAVIEERVASPLSRTLGVETILGIGAAIAVAVVILLAACFVTGLLVRTALGARSLAWVEERLLERMPAYRLARSVARGFTDTGTVWPVARIRLAGPGTSVLGFVVEEHDDGEVTVFVPSAPAGTVGMVHVVDADRVRKLDASALQVIECMGQWGHGAQALLARERPGRAPG